MFFARDYSSNEKLFSTKSLIQWFCDNISLLRSTKFGNNFKVRHNSHFRNTEAHTVIGGSTIGLGGELGSRANAVALEILNPLQTL